jgi:hypothetical protein
MSLSDMDESECYFDGTHRDGELRIFADPQSKPLKLLGRNIGIVLNLRTKSTGEQLRLMAELNKHVASVSVYAVYEQTLNPR